MNAEAAAPYPLTFLAIPHNIVLFFLLVTDRYPPFRLAP